MEKQGKEVEFEERFQQNVQRIDESCVFIEYEPNQAFLKLTSFSSISNAERLTYTNHLSELLDIIGDKIIPHLMEIVQLLSQDSYLIKKAFLIQILDILKFLKQFEKIDLIKQIITHPLLSMLQDPTLDIKEEAGFKICESSIYLSSDDQKDIILAKIFEMTNQESEENRIVSVQLLGKIAQIQTKDQMQVCNEFLKLGHDPQIRVQKEVVLNIHYIAKSVSEEYYLSNILSFYIKKCSDSQWHIRKASVEVLVEMSLASPPYVRCKELTDIMLKFLEDPNKWVKLCAYKLLSPFIATLEQQYASEKLFYHFLQMVEPSINQLSNDGEVMIQCSQYFHCVLQIYGQSKWPDFNKILIKLLDNNNKKIKQHIAQNMHKIAKIIGPEVSEKDLFDIYEQILDDPCDQIKFGLIKNFSKFLEIFDKDRRENLLEIILTVQKDQNKWRIRQMLADQIGNFTQIYTDPDTIFQYILPISIKLCNDSVCIVREKAAKQIHTILTALNDHPQYMDCVIQNINAFSIQNRYTMRQTFVVMCIGLQTQPSLFKKYFLQNFIKLGKDKVLNVRLSVALVLGLMVSTGNELINDDQIVELIKQISSDAVFDVRERFLAASIKK